MIRSSGAVVGLTVLTLMAATFLGVSAIYGHTHRGDSFNLRWPDKPLPVWKIRHRMIQVVVV